jgi:hypothetical protein
VKSGATEIWVAVLAGAVGYSMRVIQNPSRITAPASDSSPISTIQKTDGSNERTEYERALQIELSNILATFKDDIKTYGELRTKILPTSWDVKTDERKVELLGPNPYFLLRQSYLKAKEINEYRDKFQPPSWKVSERTKEPEAGKLRKLEREYILGLKEASKEISWLKNVPKPCDEILAELGT